MPLSKNLICFDPLNSTFPSKSTDNNGAFLRTSVASSEAPLLSFSTLYIILSNLDSNTGLDSSIVISESSSVLISKLISFKLTSGFFLVNLNGISFFLYPK